MATAPGAIGGGAAAAAAAPSETTFERVGLPLLLAAVCLVALAVLAWVAVRAGWIGRGRGGGQNEAGDLGDASWTGALAVPLTTSDALTTDGAMMLGASALAAGAATGHAAPRGRAPATLEGLRAALGQAGDADDWDGDKLRRAQLMPTAGAGPAPTRVAAAGATDAALVLDVVARVLAASEVGAEARDAVRAGGGVRRVKDSRGRRSQEAAATVHVSDGAAEEQRVEPVAMPLPSLDGAASPRRPPRASFVDVSSVGQPMTLDDL